MRLIALKSWKLAVLGSAFLAVVIYAVTLNGTYVYDDVKIVRTDPRVLKPARWYQLWTQPFFERSVDKLYRPLISSSFAFENYVHGDLPWVFHLVNILLHAAVSGAVALLAMRLAGVGAAWIAGLLFAVHPVHVEAVAGLVGRAETACALAIILGLCVFLHDGPLTVSRGIALSICFVIALLCKEQGILFPLLLLAAWPLRYPSRPDAAEWKRIKHLGASLCWILVGYLLLREKVASFSWERSQLDWYVNPMILSHGTDRVLMPVALLGRYMGLLVFPLHLSIDYGGYIIGASTSMRDPYLWIGFLALAAWFTLAAVAWRRRDFALLFCLLGLAVTYGIVGNVVALLGTIFADRLMYLPSVFFLLIVGIVLSRLRPRTVAPLLAVIVVLAGVRSFTYARLWNSPVRLFEATIRVHPESARAYGLLWDEYWRDGKDKEGRDVAKQAIAAVPDRWEGYVDLIRSELELGDYDAATAAADAGLKVLTSKEQRFALIQWKEIIAERKPGAGK
jgi:hypothetical protein